MKLYTGLAVALALSAFLAGSATAADNKDLIVGKWTRIEAKVKGKSVETVIEFTKDGKLKIAVKAEGNSTDVGGSFKFVDEKTIETTCEDAGAKGKEKTETIKIKSIAANELVIVNAQDKEEKFSKVKKGPICYSVKNGTVNTLDVTFHDLPSEDSTVSVSTLKNTLNLFVVDGKNAMVSVLKGAVVAVDWNGKTIPLKKK